MKRVRYTSHEDPRYIRLLASSRAWKERNKKKASYKRKKAASDLRWYLEVRNTEEFRRKRLAIKRRYSSDPKIAARERERIETFRKANPELGRAHANLFYAVKTGKVKKPKSCQRCGKIPPRAKDGRSKLQGHHPDHSKPLEVVWLCSFCHAAVNRRYK
jgi:hypothetical protein